MTITVKFFASLREDVGKNEVKLETTEPLTVAQVWAQACDDLPLKKNNVLMAVNLEYVDENKVVNDGDEVAFFPPVTGG